MSQPPDADESPEGRRALCPVCLDFFSWREEPLFERITEAQGTRWEKVDLSGIRNPVKQRDRRARCYVKCPNPSKDGTPEHYLPVSHRDHGEALVVGLVGRGRSGKTHLLVAMIHEALRGDLSRYGLTFEPADEFRHAVFQTQIDDFIGNGKKLNATDDLLHDFADYLLVRNSSGVTRPLVFFDVAGEDFEFSGKGGRGARFVLGANALLFVDDPANAIPGWRADDAASDPPLMQNRTFTAAVTRLRSRDDLRGVPVAVVLTKADELRYENPVDHWIREDDLGEPLSAQQFRAESRDVYAFLDRHGARPMIGVFETFDRGTMHFVSATGGPVDHGVYPRGVKPARVLRPLLALLAMTGVIDDPEARGIGV